MGVSFSWASSVTPGAQTSLGMTGTDRHRYLTGGTVVFGCRLLQCMYPILCLQTRAVCEIWGVGSAGVVTVRYCCPSRKSPSSTFSSIFIIGWGGSWGCLGLPPVPVGEAQEPFLFHVCLSPPCRRHKDPTRKLSWWRHRRAREPQEPAKGLGSLAVCPAGWLMPFHSFRSNAGWCINGELSQCSARYWEAGTSRPLNGSAVSLTLATRLGHPTKPCVWCKARSLPPWHTHLILGAGLHTCLSTDTCKPLIYSSIILCYSVFFFPL